MRRLVLGVIGHVDHGKTALVGALSGQETDRLPEEKTRGISIALGFAHLSVGSDTVIDLIDMPGHERFVRTMVAGATGIDAVLLVVAANEGIKPQTIEHVEIAASLGIQGAVIAVSKTDLVTAQEAQRTSTEVTRLLTECGFQPAQVVMTSVAPAIGIDTLKDALKSLAVEHRPRDANGVVYLPIDRAFSIAGRGPVITGTLRGASIGTGETLQLMPSGTAVRVRGLQVNGANVATADPGQRVAVNLRDVDRMDLSRGMALAAPDALCAGEWLTLALRAVPSAPALRSGARLRALLGTDEIDVRLRLLDCDALEPGAAAFAQLHCATAVAAPAGEHLVLRIASPSRTVAGGRILESVTARLPRHRRPIIERLERLRTLPLPALIEAEVRMAGQAGVTVKYLSQLSARSAPALELLLEKLPVVVTRAGLVLLQSEMDALLTRIPAALSKSTDGLAVNRLQSALSGVNPALLDEAVAQLLTRGTLAKRGALLVVPKPDEDRARARGETQLASTIAEKVRRGGLMPPSPSEVIRDLPSKRAVDRLLKEGVLIRAVDRAKGKEILFHQDAIAEAQRQLAPLLERPPGLLVTEIGAALGITRKYSMPLLDHLDAIRFTRRVQDRRIRGVR